MVITRVSASPRPMVTISFPVPEAVFHGLAELARKAGYPRDLYAGNLLIAAYSARRGPTGDAALEAAVAALDVKHPGQFNDSANAEIERLRAELSKVVQEGFKTAARLRAERDRYRTDCEKLETLLNDEKIANAQLFSELHAAETGKTTVTRPHEMKVGQPLTGPEIGFVAPEALPSVDPTVGLADCTRRMIIALNASGLRVGEIARDTDTPLHVVKAILERRCAGRRA